MSQQRFIRALAALLLLGVLAACGPAATPDLVTTATPRPIVVVATLTDTPAATATASPTATATVTATPSITPTPSDTPTPAPTPEGQIGPHDYPPNVNPLTGLALKDASVLARRPLAVKVSNFPDCVRPHDGIALADTVYEHYAEGGATRFTALFYTNTPERVGSVRSARLIDIEIPAMYQALFAFSGASGPVKLRLGESDVAPRILSPDFAIGQPGFFRKTIEQTNCPAVEHTLFVNPTTLWQDASNRDINQRPDLHGMVFNDTPPADGLPGSELNVRYVASYVYWGYNDAVTGYVRGNNGNTHRDALTLEPVIAQNVVVLFVNHVTTDMLEDSGGNYSVQVQLWGSGEGMLFRDGSAYPVNWQRDERDAPPSLTDANGTAVPLRPGITWYQLIPLDTPREAAEGVWTFVPPRPSREPDF